LRDFTSNNNENCKYYKNTPLIDRYTIDIDAVIEFCEKEYEKAGIAPEMVDTGAVIVTGETAKKQNAAEIVRRLSSETGKFVSASAGPNFESLLGAMGSGVVDLSRKNENTIMNVDVGGGTSNLAIASNGNVHSTSCINVGGRLLRIDENFKI
jgi:ethanolamine utilization protein EutA